MIELTLLKELILIKQVQRKSAIFATFDVFKINRLSVNGISGMSVMMY